MERCPNCGREMLETINSQRELIITLLRGASGRNIDFCGCSPNQRGNCIFWKANDITEDEAEDMGDIEHKVWLVHNKPEMGDCRSLDYGYYVNPEGRIICEACGDFYDITEDVAEYFPEIKRRHDG